MTEHDLIVIGAGPGGYVAAIRAAQLGLNVACVDANAALGGTCLRVGCIPSKAMLESSERFAAVGDELAAHGVKCASVEPDLATMLKRKDRIVSALTKGVESLFRKNKVTRYQGTAALKGDGRVAVHGGPSNADPKARYILIATGSSPAGLEGVATDGDRIVTSTEALSFAAVPEHLVVIGAGTIGLELGSVWRRLGAKVTVLEYLDRILPGTDAEIAAEAHKLLAKQGLTFRLSTHVTGAPADGDRVSVQIDGGDAVQADRVLVAVGRSPNTEGLGLADVGVATDAKGRIRVDAQFRTNVEGIYAIGDVIGGAMLAHKASEEGVACVETIVNGAGHVDYDAIPAVVYTHPEIASVGRSEEQLGEAGVTFAKGVCPFRANGRARVLGQVDGFVKVLADERTDRLLGVQIIGPRAGDLIAEAAAAMAFGATAEDIARTPHAHPTLAEALKEAALAVRNRAIHF